MYVLFAGPLVTLRNVWFVQIWSVGQRYRLHASIIISTNNYSVPSLRAVEIEVFLGGDIMHSDLHFFLNLVKAAVAVQLLQTLVNNAYQMKIMFQIW